MKKLIQVLFAFSILIGVPAMADSKSEALNVVQSWTNALNRNDVDGIVSTFATNASFFGTSTKNLVTTPLGIRQYFEVVYAQFAPLSVELGQLVANDLSPDSVVVTGYDKWKVTIEGKTVERVGRLSIAVARKDGEWRIVSFHRSALPN